jgi:hypothetical protein
MKLRIIKLTPERFMQTLQGKALTSNLPVDAEVLDVKLDLFAKQVSIIVRSDSFEDVAESMPIPELTMAASAEQKVVPKPVVAATVKPELKVESKPLIAKLVPPQPDANRWASKLENEFSPDQRKLLSFTVKGNVVVVKPVSFLKAEWEDINEVVRSLGGKWVKGDIISYWEIPLQ